MLSLLVLLFIINTSLGLLLTYFYYTLRCAIRDVNEQLRTVWFEVECKASTQRHTNDLWWADTRNLWKSVFKLEQTKLNNPFAKETPDD